MRTTALQEWHRDFAASFARSVPMEAANTPKLRPYIVCIGRDPRKPRIQFEAMAFDSLAASVQHAGLAREGERVRVLPLGETR